jgi:deazaflavin-dependent oxidoreductase (nitroreductase family)
MAKGTLIAVMNSATVPLDEFDDWYDNEHVPERQRVPGFLVCQRWIGIEDDKVSLATYDLESVDVLKSPAYLAVGGENLSPWSKRVTSRVGRVMRFEGTQILPGDQLPPEGAEGLLLNAMNIAPDLEAEFNEWYDKEHIPALAAVPGVLGARRFRGSSGNRKYVALYHLATPAVQESAEWKVARQSDWTSRLQPHFRDHLRLVCRRYVRGTRQVAPGTTAASTRPPGWQQEHARRYLASGGRDGHIWEGVSTLLLTTTGRRSGEPRTTPLIYGRDGERYLVVASRGGAPTHPSWYQNLVARPEVQVQVMAERFKARARTASAAEKAALWKTMTAIWPAYAEYQGRTTREIPVVIIERI